MKRETSPPADAMLIPAETFLQFVVGFAQMDLGRLRYGDWLNLREEFESYLGRKGWVSIAGPAHGAILASPIEPPLPEDFTEQEFHALQHQVLARLRVLAGPGESGESLTLTFPAVHWSLHPGGAFRSTPGRNQVVIHGGTVDCFLAMVDWLLSQEQEDRVAACPVCGTLFYRIKAQAYCTRLCATRMSVRNWRARQGALLAEASARASTAPPHVASGASAPTAPPAGRGVLSQPPSGPACPASPTRRSRRGRSAES